MGNFENIIHKTEKQDFIHKVDKMDLNELFDLVKEIKSSLNKIITNKGPNIKAKSNNGLIQDAGILRNRLFKTINKIAEKGGDIYKLNANSKNSSSDIAA